MTENVDLAETFAQMGGTTMEASDGHSLLGLVHGEVPGGWRDAILVEHHGPKPNPDDPDEQNRSSGNPPSYEAMRTPGFLYVEYRDGGREFYDLRSDPDELDNLAGSLSTADLTTLHADLERLKVRYVGFEIGSEFVIGYGLDVDQRYRNLDVIAAYDRDGDPLGGGVEGPAR